MGDEELIFWVHVHSSVNLLWLTKLESTINYQASARAESGAAKNVFGFVMNCLMM